MRPGSPATEAGLAGVAERPAPLRRRAARGRDQHRVVRLQARGQCRRVGDPVDPDAAVREQRGERPATVRVGGPGVETALGRRADCATAIAVATTRMSKGHEEDDPVTPPSVGPTHPTPCVGDGAGRRSGAPRRPAAGAAVLARSSRHLVPGAAGTPPPATDQVPAVRIVRLPHHRVGLRGGRPPAVPDLVEDPRRRPQVAGDRSARPRRPPAPPRRRYARAAGRARRGSPARGRSRASAPGPPRRTARPPRARPPGAGAPPRPTSPDSSTCGGRVRAPRRIGPVRHSTTAATTSDDRQQHQQPRAIHRAPRWPAGRGSRRSNRSPR